MLKFFYKYSACCCTSVVSVAESFVELFVIDDEKDGFSAGRKARHAALEELAHQEGHGFGRQAFATVHTCLAGHNAGQAFAQTDRKSTRLNSSHVRISYAVFCLKKKKSLAEGMV